MNNNTFYHGDCLFVLNHDIEPESVDLIYLDPPFFTGKVQKGEKRWSPGAMEVSYDDSKKFWKEKGITEHAPHWLKHIAIERPDFASYLFYMMERLNACHKVLKKTGSIYLHCDRKASHYLKMIMDEVFGDNNLRNEIIWFYNSGSRGKFDFGHRHDTIFRYSKTSDYVFNTDTIREPYSPNINIPKSKEHYYNPLGKIVGDVWSISILGQNDKKERTGYPTQKPIALLSRIIEVSSNKGDLVLDPFCGCGTAIIASQRLVRNWIGIDISKDAYEVTTNRQGELPLDFAQSHYISRDLGEVGKMNPNEFEQWVNEFYKATKPSPDKGVDGVMPDGTPIQTKTFKVSRKTVDEFNTSAKFHHAVPKPIKKEIIVSQVGFDESAKIRKFEIETSDEIEVQLTSPQEMLSNI